MTLAETCDRIEAALEIVEMPLCKAYLRTLVELGQMQRERDMTMEDVRKARAFPEFVSPYTRFEALKARVAEAVGK